MAIDPTGLRSVAEHEWQPVWTIVEKKPSPATQPSLCEFVQVLAQLGE